jgi:hypothetical protein
MSLEETNMKLRSLLGDDRIVAFDCAKTKIGGENKVIDIPDVCWATSEVQNAISQGLVELVGEPPMMAMGMGGAAMPAERKIKFRNYHTCKLSFDTLKAGVDPDEFINIPASLIDVREISNAISAGWLVNMEEPSIPQSIGAPAVLDEVGIKTAPAVQLPVAKARAEAVAQARQHKTAAAEPLKAKPITKSDDGSEDDLYKESVVRDAPPKKKKKRVVIETPVDPEVEEGSDDPFKPSEVKLPAAKGPADISSLFAKK